MSGVSISASARARAIVRDFIRNGKAPVAELQSKLAELCGHASIAQVRQLFMRHSPITAIPNSAGSGASTRWRFAARSHPYPLYWFVQMELAPQNDGVTVSTPHTILDVADSADPGTVVATARVYWGSSDGSFDDLPVNFGGGLAMLETPGGLPWSPDPSTTYLGRFYDVNYARIFAACVFEVSLEADTDDGYAPVSTSLGTPIYDADRSVPLVMARSIFMNASAPLWHWGSERDTTAPSIDPPASMTLSLDSAYVDGDEESFDYLQVEESRGISYTIGLATVGTNTDVAIELVLPYRTSDDAGFVLQASFSTMGAIETALETANSGWTVTADDTGGSGPLVITFERASLSAGYHEIYIPLFPGEVAYPLGTWRWGTSSTPGSGTVYFLTDNAIGFQLSGSSNEVAVATGGINQQIEVGDLYNQLSITPDPAIEDTDEIVIDNTVTVYSNSDGGTVTMVFQITDAVTCSEPTIDSNPDSFTQTGSWSSPGGGIQWEGTFIKSSGVVGEGAYRLAIATTPSTTGTFSSTVESSWSVIPYSDTNSDTVTVDPAGALVSDIEKTSGTGGSYDAGAATNETISGAGRVEVTVNVTNKERAFGFSTSDTNVNFNTIQRGVIFTNSGSAYKTESGTFTLIGSYSISDVWAVVRDGSNNISVTQNGSGVATMTSLSGALLVDTALADSNARLDDVKLYDDVTQIGVTWQNVTNVTIT